MGSVEAAISPDEEVFQQMEAMAKEMAWFRAMNMKAIHF